MGLNRSRGESLIIGKAMEVTSDMLKIEKGWMKYLTVNKHDPKPPPPQEILKEGSTKVNIYK